MEYEKTIITSSIGNCITGDFTVFFKLYGENYFLIERVIYNNPATIVLWKDGTKTVVKCQEGDSFSKELGLAMCFAKRAHDNHSNYNEVFKKWAYDD